MSNIIPKMHIFADNIPQHNEKEKNYSVSSTSENT